MRMYHCILCTLGWIGGYCRYRSRGEEGALQLHYDDRKRFYCANEKFGEVYTAPDDLAKIQSLKEKLEIRRRGSNKNMTLLGTEHAMFDPFRTWFEENPDETFLGGE